MRQQSPSLHKENLMFKKILVIVAGLAVGSSLVSLIVNRVNSEG